VFHELGKVVVSYVSLFVVLMFRVWAVFRGFCNLVVAVVTEKLSVKLFSCAFLSLRFLCKRIKLIIALGEPILRQR
jgi:hypothetical protein